MCTIPFDLLVGRDGTEDDFGEFASFKRTICNASHNFKGFLDYCHGQVCSIVDKTSDVVFRHFGELLLEDTFKASKYDEALSGAIIVDNAKLNLSISFFDHCRLQSG
jgi:hypothetical protein